MVAGDGPSRQWSPMERREGEVGEREREKCEREKKRGKKEREI